MPPQPTPDPNQVPVPPQPAAPPQPPVAPVATPQPEAAPAPVAPQPIAPTQPAVPVAPAAPVPTMAPQGAGGVQLGHISKERKIAMALSCGGLAVFVVGLLFGYAALLGAFLAAFGVNKARVIKYTPALVVGYIAFALNLVFFLIAWLTG